VKEKLGTGTDGTFTISIVEKWKTFRLSPVSLGSSAPPTESVL